MLITTAGRSTSELTTKAKALAASYSIRYIERTGVSVASLKDRYQADIVVVGKNQLYISPLQNGAKLFFHPNLAMVRAKRLFKGEADPFIQATKLKEGMSLLDCTLGLASDSIIASIAVSERGVVTGIEGSHLLYFLIKEGLQSVSTTSKPFDQAMRRINVVHSDHLLYLKKLETNSFDVVYIDPMFQTGIDTSDGINVIREQTLSSDISFELIEEAKRVAKSRVVIKDHWKSKRFVELGFTQQKRKTSLFHYGIIEL
ncbi:class I SAM-dependent methyltransferase [Aquibacillus salsiterrae]|uniref:Class I SAM-dependent methyltransferase n=1 Tax=Aquibacillus salsiterrae TaxID=2950439 RepID=A0A9X3WEZ3_9BACI|nr:class I SAM-dependent methyltransferase [Aquibacillus salsiterrae]MDC3416194.1 class I SAM-dependent methyltransferase [Aquibacillus salsiterrae]